jgi:hypothetical protein
MDTTQAIPEELEAKVKRELEAGERIRWMGRPIPRSFTSATIILFLFAIPWTAFALCWEVATSWMAWGSITQFKQGPVMLFSIIFPIFGLPFVLIGFGMLAAPLWARRYALKTVYVITDQRAITFVVGRTTTVKSYSPDQLQDVFRRERKDGTGDVIFSQRVWLDSGRDRHIRNLGFLNIQEAQRVEQMLKEMARQHS